MTTPTQDHPTPARNVGEALAQPVSIQSLAVFRIVFGALLAWDVWRFVEHDRIWRYYVQPEFFFTYPGFGWIAPLGEPYLHIAWFLVGIFAVLVMLGLFYRVAIVGFTVLFSYFFLLDKAQYLNHFYMVILFAVLLCFLPAHRAFSLDARLWPRLRCETVPYASVFVLRAQIEIILIFAGIVKITPDWLAGEPLGLWLREQADVVPFGALFQHDWLIQAGAWATILLHILGAPLLLWRRTRLPVFLIYCCFHVSNAYFFNIGIFPWLTIGATLIFFPPDWPQRFARWLLGRFEALPPRPAFALPAAGRLSPVALAAIALWLAVQVALPLRFAAYPSEVRWAGDGHRFAWRMRMYDREADGVFVVTDPASGTTWEVDPLDYLTERQAWTMLPRADMVRQFAGHLEDVWRRRGYADVAVTARIEKSLNGRDFQPFIDPAVDLTTVEVNPSGPDPWVLPLTTPLRTAAAR